MKILVINGPNMNMLGIRQPEIYGSATYDDLMCHIREFCRGKDIELDFYQSNHEGAIVDRLHAAYFEKIDGIVMNAAAYTHTSVAIADAIAAISIPTVEVHISDVSKREGFRAVSYMREKCVGVCSGRGFDSYTDAISLLLDQRA